MRIVFNESREKSSLKGKLFCIAMSVLLAVSFMPLHVFAETEMANGKADLNDYGTEEYWGKYFGCEITYYDDLIETNRELSGEYRDGCYQPGVYFLKENHKWTANPTESGLVINGDVTLIFVKTDDQPNGPSLQVTGGDGKGRIGGGAGILLKEGNSLLVKGVGSLSSIGGTGGCGSKGGEGKNAAGSGQTLKSGEGGYGGEGGGGAGAGIGTCGSAGGERVYTAENEFELTSFSSDFDSRGVDSVDGKSSESSQNAGMFKAAGNVKLNVNGGVSPLDWTSITEPVRGGQVSAWTYDIHRDNGSLQNFGYDGNNDYVCCAGPGGGGGNGATGFCAMGIGSGGIGGASGGTGGSGGRSLNITSGGKPEPHCSVRGGGGGGGAGSTWNSWIFYAGGEGATGPCYSDGEPGQNGTKESTGGLGGAGSKPTKLTHSQTLEGRAGGNGGSLSSHSGNGGICYSVQPIDQNQHSYYESPEHLGKGAEIRRAFPVDECEIVFKDSTEEGMYKYTGNSIHPDFILVHKPTGTVIDRAAYDVEYGVNVLPESKNNNYVQVKSTGYGQHDLLMDKTMSEASGKIKTYKYMNIVYGLKIEGISMGSHVYDGEPVKPCLDNLKITTDVKGEDVTRALKPLLKISYYRDGVEVPEAKDIGTYTLCVKVDNDVYSVFGKYTETFVINPQQ